MRWKSLKFNVICQISFDRGLPLIAFLPLLLGTPLLLLLLVLFSRPSFHCPWQFCLSLSNLSVPPPASALSSPPQIDYSTPDWRIYLGINQNDNDQRDGWREGNRRTHTDRHRDKQRHADSQSSVSLTAFLLISCVYVCLSVYLSACPYLSLLVDIQANSKDRQNKGLYRQREVSLMKDTAR